MKKIIKIFSLVIFIILIFGITTSNATDLTVTKNTTAKTMLDHLNANTSNRLTGLTSNIKNGNAYLYCRNYKLSLVSTAKYKLATSGLITYRTDYESKTDKENAVENNEYIKAYIIAGGNYDKYPDRQRAWWYSLGQISTKNDVYKIAEVYQEYKKTEVDFRVEEVEENESKIIDNNIMIYGPIKVYYSYKKATSGNYSDEFGGFNYAFYNGDEIISSGVELVNSSYETIESSLNNSKYYEVRTDAYNNEELYIKVDLSVLNNINNIQLKIQEISNNYLVSVYEIEGTYTIDQTHVIYCMDCQEYIESATKGTAYNCVRRTVDLLEINGRYYKYAYYTTMYNVSDVSNIKNVICTDIKGNQTTRYNSELDNTTSKYYVYWEGKLLYGGGSYDGAVDCLYELTTLNGTRYVCKCGWPDSNNSYQARQEHANTHIDVKYQYTKYYFSEYNGNGCAKVRYKGTYESQPLFIIDSKTSTTTTEKEIEIDIPLTTSIEITKTWQDYDHAYNLRPETLKFNIFRSTDKSTWEKLTENTDYKLTIESKEGNTWKILITDLMRLNNEGKQYFFKVEEQELVCYQASYPDGKEPTYNEDISNWYIDIENSLKEIDISGYVWLDGQTGIKPAVTNNGVMDNGETRMENITVYLYYKNPKTGEVSKIETAKTDANGYYEFKDKEIGCYYVEFEYDGINYEDTGDGGDSKAFETDGDRNTFNARFKTITYGKAIAGTTNAVTTLNYNYANNKSTLITAKEGNINEEIIYDNSEKPICIKTKEVNDKFIMNAYTTKKEPELYKADTTNLNLGLVKRGTDIALSTDVYDAIVTINGQATDYTFNKEDESSIVIGSTQTSEEVSYNLNLYSSDYNYRIRNYVSNDGFKENDYITDEVPEGVKTGDELKVYVEYELNLQNQSSKTTKINEVKYTYDSKYSFLGLTDSSYTVQNDKAKNVLTIDLNGLELTDGQTKTLHLIFEVNNNDGLITGNFSNKAEITSYSTDEGLIDVDSQPGNFVNSNQVEDDCDTAGGLSINVVENTVRSLTGKVFDSDNNQNVNDVIVQLIELKTVNGKVYEYIWQETVSGTGKGLRLNAAGTALEEYTYTKADGTYEFIGVIPGDYIVRFIYGDGTTYDMTGNVIKYNGQDYKSTEDANYNTEWYNSSSYTSGASVARDNEARRLETMAYSVEIDAQKGVLLKLLNNVTVDDLNETEKKVIIATYNNLYDPDITEVTTEVINKLLKEQVLKNTWMCAETSKIKVAVDTEIVTNTSTSTTVNGITKNYVSEISNINLGLELRPVTKIELEKYITGFKLTAANGQTLVNAYIDVNEYLNDPTNISNKVQGIRDNVTILGTVWQYEVAPTEINTIVDGASLEFEYTLVVKNTGDTDYLSSELANTYNNNDIGTYKNTLASKATEIKGYMRNGTYITNIGNALGDSYYVGGTNGEKVLTEVTNIRDYVNNDLTFVFAYEGKVEIDNDENLSHTHRILRDDYSMQEATISTILKTTEATGKMSNTDSAVMYTVTLGKNPISSTGNLNFENYIAEVMSYTNAAGRRTMTSTPGNAEIIDHEYRTGKSHEIDEADTARIQIGAATGEDGKTNYIIIIAVVAGIAIIATGAFVVKKYVIK